jgi:hypothetical protein
VKSLIVLVSSNREINPSTAACITKLQREGASYVVQRGSSDVALARNLALSQAYDLLAEPRFDAVLMVDDDMLFETAQAAELVAHVRKTKHAASAVYATSGKTTACTRDPETIAKLNGQLAPCGAWLAGCGFLAIHREALQRVAYNSETFHWNGRECRAFTKTHVLNGRWWSEDYWLSLRLGGVDVLPMAVGHIKLCPIYPNDDTLALIARGAALPVDDGRPLTLTER